MYNLIPIKNWKRGLLVLAVLLISLLIFMGVKPEGRYQLKDEIQKKELKFFGTKPTLSNLNNYVSIAKLDKHYYVIANYNSLLLLNDKDDKLCLLKPSGFANSEGPSPNANISPVYVPTGVFIDKNNVLYVANYKGNNILQGNVNAENCEVHFTKEFSSINSKGPENVSVDYEKNLLVSANYDAGTVTAFDLSDGKELWSTNIGQAHGVTISGDAIYATGLLERKIYKLNLSDGKIQYSRGSVGWNPMKNQFLWPTSIYPYANNQLIVADPQTGFISFINKESLKTIRYMGGNGPSYNWFNYPYAAYPTDKQIIILSSMRGNILFLNQAGTKVQKNLISFNNNWPKLDYSKNSFGSGWNAYINVNGPKLSIRGQQYHLGFGHLHPLNQGPTLRVPNINTLYDLGPYIYFTQGFSSANMSLFFSSSSTTLLAIANKEQNPDVLIPNLIRLDSWLYQSDIINADGVTSAQSLSKEIEAQANQFYSVLDKNGWIPPQELYQLSNFRDQTRKLNYPEFQKYLDVVFQSSIGREFKLAYDHCNSQACNINDLRAAAEQYYSQANGYNYLDLDEYVLVGMLSGFSTIKPDTPDIISYNNCDGGQYYKGFDLDALKQPTSSSYFSAVDLKSSTLCFSSKNNYFLESINFGWLSQEEKPVEIALYGIKPEKDKTDKELIQIFQITKNTSADDLSTTLYLHQANKYPLYELKLLQGGRQNRLLLRSLQPTFVKQQNNKPIYFDNCDGLGKYYEGYGINAVETAAQNTYLSAYDLNTSYLCFGERAKEHSPLDEIRISWLSTEETPKKLALYGILDNATSQEKSLIGEYTINQNTGENGTISSNIKVHSQKTFDRYMIKLLEGGKQNRLLVQTVDPIFKPTKQATTSSPILNLVDTTSKKLHYGSPGVNSENFNPKESCNSATITKTILSAKTAHCGNYAYLFISALPASYNWTVFDVRALDGRIHSVVEITHDKITQVADPTLGVLYPCSMNDLIHGSCNYAALEYLTKPDQSLGMYKGAGFFYGAEIKGTYHSEAQLDRLYCKTLA